MESPAIGQGLDPRDIHNATMACIFRLEECLSVKPLMRNSWPENRLADLNLWASGVGALARPEASLDRRLQYQPKTGRVLSNLLLTLGDFINGCRIYALNETHDEEPYDKTGNEIDSEPTSLRSTVGAGPDLEQSSASWFAALGNTGANINAENSTDSGTSTESNGRDTEEEQAFEATLKKAMKDVDDIFDQLIMLGLAVRRSGTAARLHGADATFSPDMEGDFRNHLEFILVTDGSTNRNPDGDGGQTTAAQRMEKANQASRIVTPVQRHLILANLRRRHRFRYAEKHGRRLAQSMTHSGDQKKTPEGHFSSTTFARAQQEPLRPPDMTMPTPSQAEGNMLEMLEPAQAPASLASVSMARIHYPSPPPTSPQMGGFKCPCCHQTLPEMFKHWSRWRYVSLNNVTASTGGYSVR